MFKDEQRHKVWSDLGQYGLRCFTHILTPQVFAEAGRRAGVAMTRSPLCVANLAWLGIAAAWHRTSSFAQVLTITWMILEDSQSGKPSSRQQRSIRKSRGRGSKASARSKHDPRGKDGKTVSEEAFAQGRQRMPLKYWTALLIVLGEIFEERRSRFIRWNGFRLLALDGTCFNLPASARLISYYGRPRGKRGAGRCPQARMALLQFPLARIPYRYVLGPYGTAEITLAEQLLGHLKIDDLVLLDRGFWSYCLLAGIQAKGAFFGIRMKAGLKLETVKTLGPGDRLVSWTPHCTKFRKWKREGRVVPDSLTFRVIDYQIPGFRPSAIATNVLDPKRTSRDDWTRLTTESDAGRRLLPGLYHFRWEIETTFRELKVTQQWHRRHWLRSHTPHSVEYEIAGHVLLYLLIRWLMVDASAESGVDPLRVSFIHTLRTLEMLFYHFVTSPRRKVLNSLLPNLRRRIAASLVPYRPGRHYPRPGDSQPKYKGHNLWQLPAKLAIIQT
jgi:hypothetical protein